MSPTEKRPRDPLRAERIIRAARDLARDQGVQSITHRTVADRAGVPLGSTTYYFATIDDLLDQAIRREIDDFHERMERVLAATEGQDALHRVTAIMRRESDASVRGSYALYLTALLRPTLRPLAAEWAESVIVWLETFLPRDRAVAVAVFLDGYGIRATLLGRTDHPTSSAEFERQLRGLIGD